MRSILVVNGALLALALVLFCFDWWSDRSFLMGSSVKSANVIGRRMEDFLDGQPVVPDRIFISWDGDLIGFVYKPDRRFWYKYPGIEVDFYNERVTN